ncbi:MAG: DNA adenine methylase [Candidatus Omnitrophica bacterium]|nr:DNA adenine methylase [Candidatus Omnitrophota bacterium]
MRYYGCKNRLLDFIEMGVAKTGINHGSTFCDLFSGTTTVAQHFKKKGYTVVANDILEFSYAIARAYIKNNQYPLFKDLKNEVKGINGCEKNIEIIIDYLNSLHPINGFIYRNYCPSGSKGSVYQRQYFSDENGKKIDAIRSEIYRWKNESLISEDENYILLASLLEAIPFVANISGNYAAFLKCWDRRALKPLRLKVPNIPSSIRKNKVFKTNANELMRKISCDILYMDPPYNERQYAPNYFLLELIAEGWFGEKKPQIYGKTGMRPYENQKSLYCQKQKVKETFKDLIENADTKYMLLSYNDEGLMCEEEIIDTLSLRGKVNIIEKEHRRYRSINQDETDRRTVKEKLYFVKVAR